MFIFSPREEKGQVFIFVALTLAALFLFTALVISVGQLIYWRVRMQQATDLAAQTTAVWQARALNQIAILNYALIAALGADIKSGRIAETIAKIILKGKMGGFIGAVQKAQDKINQSYPGLGVINGDIILKLNGGRDVKRIHLPPKSYSLKLKRLYVMKIPTFMVKDEPKYWNPPESNGALAFVSAYKSSQEAILGSRLLGIRIPSLVVVSQARPYGGNMWLPTWRAKLTKVTFTPGVLH